MAFFENIGKSITQAGQSAAKKTKDMTETVRINNAISDEEKRLAELQRKIGELYISLHATDYEKDFAGLMGEVQEVNGKIRDYQKQLQDIKGFVPCKNCGAAMPNGALFCSACGAAAPKPEQPTKQPAGVFCPNCGTQNDAGACFCQGCGKPVQQLEPVQQPEPAKQPEPVQTPEPVQSSAPEEALQVPESAQASAPVQQPEPEQQPEPVILPEPEPESVPQPEAPPNRCPGCGGEIEEGDLFCAGCGMKLQ